jgi:arginine decarboxylase
MFVAKKVFLTKGVGRHREKLTSFEMALRDASIADQNLVRVSSIFPPHCRSISRKEGAKKLQSGAGLSSSRARTRSTSRTG